MKKNTNWIKTITPRNIVGVVVAALMSSFAIVNFVRPASLIPAGITGLTMLLQREFFTLFGWNLSFGILYLLINVLVLSLVFKYLGKRFVVLSMVHVILTSVFSELWQPISLADDPFLLAIFGGVINGFAVTLALKMGGSAGGTDFIAIYFSSVKNRPMWDRIMYFNVGMLLFNGLRSNWELSLYSIIYQFSSTEILSTYHDRYKLSSMHIITESPEAVSEAILSVIRHGITEFQGKGVYSSQPKTMLYLVVNTFEIKSVIDAVKKADSRVFIEIGSVERIEGNYRQKPLD